MLADDRFYQYTVENQVLDHVKRALRNTLTSDTERMGLERKVSSVRFVTESLERHLQRMLDFEDEVGLVDPLEANKPHLVEKAASLQREHEQIRLLLQDLSEAAANLTSAEETYFHAFCQHAASFLNTLDKHENQEIEVLQQIYTDDEGGEG
jgi:hemerythrin-like domain-containing protein